MNSLVSVCIPTCNRPQLLREAIVSCLKQTYRPLELLIGDDSQNDASADVINAIKAESAVALRYQRNHLHLGQAGNVNKLFQRAR